MRLVTHYLLDEFVALCDCGEPSQSYAVVGNNKFNYCPLCKQKWQWIDGEWWPDSTAQRQPERQELDG